MPFLTAGLLYMGAAIGFYAYLIKTSQVLPANLVEATMPACIGPVPATWKHVA